MKTFVRLEFIDEYGKEKIRYFNNVFEMNEWVHANKAEIIVWEIENR